MSSKITMQQIADSLGVSKFVVSKALAGKEGVSDATREKVIQAATKLGYFAQKNAYMKTVKHEQQPKTSRPGRQSVLVLMPNIRFQTQESLYWGRIVDGISAKLEKDGYGMVIVSEQSVDSFVHFLNPSGISGLIGVGEISTSLLLEIHRLGLPLVLVDHEDPLIPSDTLFANNFESVYRLTRHLIGIGHRKLAFAGSTDYSRSFYDRFLGFRSALEDEGLWDERGGGKENILIDVDGLRHEDAEEPVKQWLAKRLRTRELPTALVCANDMIAIGAVRAAQSHGLNVPAELSVAGFDNIEDAAKLEPALTTVHVPKEALGRRAVERLLQRIDAKDEPAEKILLACELMYRGTTSAVGRQSE
ncbi:LacI family DNA-binding transcriptional regulator [Paenibacillus soyae]|uniref:LacI family DNA-binding transcriptional regulator n=1 Tax=Paenibacillus soyae TaxID=2969249 RepID=A0A9X2MUH6_9BACL|nr:LacI family DNA-binding transcriptional regulator [Paenibacillus soyae]MCR2806073.1 LacI family DNA-binding transcriptional regulator [Paenibacillus soyae]